MNDSVQENPLDELGFAQLRLADLARNVGGKVRDRQMDGLGRVVDAVL